MTPHTPAIEHAEFDSLCEQVDDYQQLPAFKSTSPEMVYELDPGFERQTAPLDGLILAGLVSP